MIGETDYKYDEPYGRVCVNFPMYGVEDHTFCYTKSDILRIKIMGWVVGSEDMEYVELLYGISNNECEKVFNMYWDKLSDIILGEDYFTYLKDYNL